MKKSENKTVVTLEIAQDEVDKFLSFHRVDDDMRDENKSSISTMVKRVMDGSLIINDDATMVYTLADPIGSTTELKIGNRAERGKVITHMKNVDPKDVDSRMAAYTACLTNQPKAIIFKLSNYDQKLTDAVVGFIVG